MELKGKIIKTQRISAKNSANSAVKKNGIKRENIKNSANLSEKLCELCG